MLLGKEDVEKIIPQKSPMAMVDGLLEQETDFSISQLKILKENIFCENGFFSEAGIIENIAQTAALRNSYEAVLENKEPQIGYIGSLKRIKIYHLPKVNSIIKTKIIILNNLMNVSIIKGETFCEGQLIAEGEMNIFLQ
jgi:3-hydroxymyristoyl/3-hydroxydecanoyl-(acyl carrier protein) dehydratase